MQKRQNASQPLKLITREWLPYSDFPVGVDLSNVKEMPEILRLHPDLQVTYVPHCHDWHEIEIVTGGTAIHHINGKAYPVGIGDVHILQPGMVHYFSQPQGFFACDIHFVLEGLPLPTELLARMAGFRELMLEKPQTDFIRGIRLGAEEVLNVAKTIGECGNELRYHHDGFEARCIGILTEMLVLLCRRYAQQNDPAPMAMRERVARASLFMRRSRHKLSIEDVARQVNVSPRTLQRDFLQVLKQTPMAYLRQMNLQGAIDFLNLTERSIEDIALSSGFGSVVYFCQAFKRAYGCTPSQYRAKYSNCARRPSAAPMETAP